MTFNANLLKDFVGSSISFFSSSKSWFALQIAKIQNGLLVLLLYKPFGLALAFLFSLGSFQLKSVRTSIWGLKRPMNLSSKKINPLL